MCPLSMNVTRMNVLQPCVSLISRTCLSTRPFTTPNTNPRVVQCWSDRCSRVVRRGQVWSSRCGWVSCVHFHSSVRCGSLCTPDPADRESSPSSGFHHLQNDSESIPAWKKHHRPISEKTELSEILIESLENGFGLSRRDAQYVLVSCLSHSLTEEDFLHNLHLLHECSITGNQIYRIPWILNHKTDVLSKKLTKIKERHLFRKHSEGLGFCYLSMERMTSYQTFFKKEELKFPHHPNRIYYLADRLKVPVQVFTEKIGKPHRTLTMNIQRLDSMIDMFYKYGLPSEDIVSDLWVFGYSASKAEERLRRARNLGCTDLRPWMCRCPDRIFDRFCERYQCEKELMGDHKSLIDYLSERLECDPIQVRKSFQSNMVMKKVHISKFNRIIDLLLAEGITPEEIRSCMRVFQYSEERTAARIKELKRVGYFPFPMFLLCRTAKRFDEVMLQYKKQLNLKP